MTSTVDHLKQGQYETIQDLKATQTNLYNFETNFEIILAF